MPRLSAAPAPFHVPSPLRNTVELGVPVAVMFAVETFTPSARLPLAMFAAGTPEPTCAPGREVKFVPTSVGAPYMAPSVMDDTTGRLVKLVPCKEGAPYIDARVIDEAITDEPRLPDLTALAAMV